LRVFAGELLFGGCGRGMGLVIGHDESLLLKMMVELLKREKARSLYNYVQKVKV
jgi:hypothetical protein